MKNILQAIKTIVIGGAVFLVPVIIVIIVLGKAFGLMIRLAEVISKWTPIDSIGGVALVNILAVLAIVIVCFLAGVAARSRLGKKLSHGLESALLGGIPGYTLVKGFTDSMVSSERYAESFIPVIARFDDVAQLGFEVDRTKNGSVVIFMPGAPNPWSGSVILMNADRVDRLDMSVAEVMKNIRKLGAGSAQYSGRVLRK